MKYAAIMIVDGAVQQELIYDESEMDDAQQQVDTWQNDDMLMEDGNVVILLVPRTDAQQEALDVENEAREMRLYTR